MTQEEALQMQQDFNDAINFAIVDDEPRAFLTAWRDANWEALRDEWPDFELPPMAKEQLGL